MMPAVAHFGMILLILAFAAAVIWVLWWGFTRIFALVPETFQPVKTIVYVVVVVIVCLFVIAFAYDAIVGGLGILR